MLSDYDVKDRELVQDYLKRIGIYEQESIGKQVLFVKNGDEYSYYYRTEDNEFPIVCVPLGERFRDSLLSLRQMYRGVLDYIHKLDEDGVSDLEYEKCAYIYFGYELEKMIALADKYATTGMTIGFIPFAYMREKLTRPLLGKPREVEIRPELWEEAEELKEYLPKYQRVRNAICLNAGTFSKNDISIPVTFSEHQIKAFHIENDVQLMEVILSLLDDFNMKLNRCARCKELYATSSENVSHYCPGCEEWKDYQSSHYSDPTLDRVAAKTSQLEREMRDLMKKYDL